MRFGAFIFFSLLALNASTETLSIKGSNTIGARLTPALAEKFLLSRGCKAVSRLAQGLDHVLVKGDDSCAGLSIDIEARGTATGFAALNIGSAELAMASRPVNAAEQAQLPALKRPEMEQVIALDGLAIIVAPSNPLRSLSLIQVRDLFIGESNSLAAVGGPAGPVKRYTRDDASGTFDTFKHLVLADAKLAADSRRFESSEELVKAVMSDPQGIGFVGLAAIGGARALRISGSDTEAMAPSEFSVATEDYLLSRRLYLYHLPDASELTLAFIEFTRSSAAMVLIEREHFVSPSVRMFSPRLASTLPADYLALTHGMARLSLNFRFADGMSLLDSKALADLERLSGWLKAQAKKPTIVLIGFSDGNESVPYLSMALSTDRVDYVAQRLNGAGVVVNKARGLGSVVPLADNASGLGRQKNRRVEVWVSTTAPATQAATRAP